MKKIFFTFMILFILSKCFALEKEAHTPQTVKTAEDFYVTTGSVAIAVPIDRARSTIENVSLWKNWMLEGLDGSQKSDHFLLIYIINFLNPEENALEAVVDFRFLRSLGKSSEHIPFNLIWKRSDAGELYAVTAILSKENAILDSANYKITLYEVDNTVIITYRATIRFKGFFEFFIPLTIYKNTIEWYLEKIIENFITQIQT